MSEIQGVMAGQRIDERTAWKSVARSRGISKSEAYRLLRPEKSCKG
jgi:hypothetical protein